MCPCRHWNSDNLSKTNPKPGCGFHSWNGNSLFPAPRAHPRSEPAAGQQVRGDTARAEPTRSMGSA